MVLRKVPARAEERDAASRELLAEYERIGNFAAGRRFTDLARSPESLLAHEDVRAALWIVDGSEPSGLALWDFVPGVGRRLRLYLTPSHRSGEALGALLDELERRSEYDGPIASVADNIPGVTRAVQETVFPARGFFALDRLVLRLTADLPIPEETIAGGTEVRPLGPGDEEELVNLMRDAYDQSAGESAPWLFYRDPRQDARDAVRDILGGHQGEWLGWASFGVDVAGALRAASLVTRLEVPVLAEVMVAPNLRGIGLAYSVALGSVRALRERGEDEVRTVTTSHDLRALRLCRRIGFEPTDVPAAGLWVSRPAVVPPAVRHR